MIPLVERYIRDHIDRWPIQPRSHGNLTALIRSNKEDNGIVNRFWIGKVVFWFAGEDRSPCLVSKILDSSVTLEPVEKSRAFQEKVNEKVGHAVFPRIFDIVKLGGNLVIFMEPVKGPNYEVELSRALHGPERSLSNTISVFRRQFREIGELFKHVHSLRISGEPRRWGDWAFRLGQDFRKTCGFDASSLTDAHLEKMRKAIDSVVVPQNLMLVEDHLANYLPGPRAVDQIHPNIEELVSGRPGFIDTFLFIIAYFRAGPIRTMFGSDWLYVIAAAIMDRQGKTIIGPPVRDLLRDTGLNPDESEVIWAFVMATFLIRVKNEIEFHRENPFFIDSLREDFAQSTKRLVEIQESLTKARHLDVRLLVSAPDAFFGKGPPRFLWLKRATSPFLNSRPRLKAYLRGVFLALLRRA